MAFYVKSSVFHCLFNFKHQYMTETKYVTGRNINIEYVYTFIDRLNCFFFFYQTNLNAHLAKLLTIIFGNTIDVYCPETLRLDELVRNLNLLYPRLAYRHTKYIVRCSFDSNIVCRISIQNFDA